MKPETQELINNLLVSVPIEINYKHDIFLRKTKQYAKYETKELKAQQYIKDKDLNPQYKKLLDEKKEISFTDIKLDIINNNLDKEYLHELEDKYVRNCNKYAIAADDTLDDFFKDDIADKLIKFLISVNSAKEGELTGYIDRVGRANKNMKLVYKDSEKPPYQFVNTDELLDAIAKSAVAYCNNMTDYSNLDKVSKLQKKSKKDKTTPLFIRRVCAIVCYTLLDFGNYVSIKTKGKQLETNSGVTKQIMSDLHKRCKNLGYEYFTKENKLFQYDKWSISPEEMLRRRSYIPPKAPISYAGMKQGWLGYMIAELQKQVTYKQFLDAFGGSGMSNVQFRHNTDAEYYVNDFHFANVAYYRVLKAPNTEYKQFLDCLMQIQKCIKIAVDNDTTGKWTRDQFNEHMEKLFNIYTNVADVCINVASLNYVDFNGVCSDFLDVISSIDKSYTKCSYQSYIIVAAVFTAFANMTVSGSIEPHIIGSTTGFVNKSRDDFKKLFDNLRTMYKTTDIVNMYGADANALLVDATYNNDVTLAYLDSPYIGTMEYNASENSSDEKYPKGTVIAPEDTGKEFISNDFPMEDLLNACENYKGKFIFSCRLNMPSPEPQAIVTGTLHKEKGSKLTDDEVRQHFNNYLWFFRRWKRMKNIDDCYMYCMVDTDWYLLEECRGILYYNNQNDSKHYKPVNEDMKKKFVEADWKMEISPVFKERMYDYLRAIILCGQNYEIMITNYNAEAPNFDSMYEYMTNLYDKGAEPTSKKTKKDSKEVKGKGNREILIPEHGMFVKIPMKLVVELVLTEFDSIKRSFKI